MSMREEKAWSLWCDWPGCERQFESYEYSIFGDGWDPDEIVRDADGRIGTDGTHYCRQHPAVWASNHEDGQPFPPPPFLLIHDGDTDDDEDDGKVTYWPVPS